MKYIANNMPAPYLSLSDIGYGTGDGFKGWNCRHDWYPYFEGSTRMYSEKDLKELDAKNIEFPDGSMHTLYEAEQYQRALERRIRQTKRTLAACEEALGNLSDKELLGNLKKEFNRHSVKLKQQQSELNAFCRKTNLLPDNSRTQVSGFGRSTSQKAVWADKKNKLNPSARQAKRNNGVYVNYNPNADFSIKINGYDERIIDALSKASANVAKLGSKDGVEHLYLINLLTGEADYYEKGNEYSVGFEGYREFIKEHKNERFAFVHNHNMDGYFSETDMRTLLTTDSIDVIIAVRLDGVRYIAEKVKKAPSLVLYDELFPDEIKELNLKYRNGIISAGERTRMREEIIVDGLLKEFTKGLIELE